MPWSLKVATSGFVLFLAGAGLIGFACFESGWDAIGHFAWGLVTAASGLGVALPFCLICAATQAAWRKRALVAAGATVLLLATLFVFARTA